MTAPASTTTTSSSSRRALLAGALGGLGAWAASAIGRASPVRAGTDGDVVLGASNGAVATTTITNSANDSHVFVGHSIGRSGTGVYGASAGGDGVRGQSDTGIGVRGTSGDGMGVSGSTGSSAAHASGVRGRVSSTNPGSFSAGVRGENLGTGGNGTGVYGTHDGSGWGVYGYAPSGVGVYGHNAASDQPAMRGLSAGNSTGVLGTSGSSVPAPKPKTGVYGYANQDGGSRGVYGFSGRGAGVYGQANKNGFAMRANGRIKADKVSGVATIPAGSTSVTVSPNVNVTSGSFVLLTPKVNIGSRGLWFTTNASADSFTIRMSSSRSSGTKVAWLLLG